MKKIIAFVSSLLLVIPSFAQKTGTKDVKATGVSKVKQGDVKPTPAATNSKPANIHHKDHKTPTHSDKGKKSSGNTTTPAPK